MLTVGIQEPKQVFDGKSKTNSEEGQVDTPKKAIEEQSDDEYETIKEGLLLSSCNYFVFRNYSLIGMDNKSLLGGLPSRDYSLMLVNEDVSLYSNFISTWLANTSNLTEGQKKLNEELLNVFNTFPCSGKKNDYVKKLKEFKKK